MIRVISDTFCYTADKLEPAREEHFKSGKCQEKIKLEYNMAILIIISNV